MRVRVRGVAAGLRGFGSSIGKVLLALGAGVGAGVLTMEPGDYVAVGTGNYAPVAAKVLPAAVVAIGALYTEKPKRTERVKPRGKAVKELMNRGRGGDR